MPSYFPEGNTAEPFDDELRSLHKWCSLLIASNGDPGTMDSVFPEGCSPNPGDTEERLTQKINAILKG